MALSDLFAGADFFAGLGFATAAFAFVTGALRGAGLRVIFAMIGIY
jgi:hypothetical protein